MKILVCYKYIRDENEISVAPDRTIKADAAAWVISPYDLNAIEAGMKLAAASGGTVEVLTAGGEAVDNSKMRKAVLSRGPAKMYGVRCPECGDLLSTARLLKQAIEKIGGVDLVICGEGSGDMYSQQLGNLLGALMGLPTLNCVSSLEYDAGVLTAGRVSGSRTEKYHISCPAVVSVTSDICRAHIPSMKEILAAGKKPVEVWGRLRVRGVGQVGRVRLHPRARECRASEGGIQAVGRRRRGRVRQGHQEASVRR